MSKSFTNLSALQAEILKSIDTALDTTVSQVVKESIQTAVSDVVYGAGSPSFYKRRNLRGESLGSPEQMHHEVSGGMLIVTDDAPSKKPWNNGRSLAENIEFGYGDEWYSEARPFMLGPEGAKSILEQDRVHIESLRDALIGMGFEVI